jgi:hypothetical protein
MNETYERSASGLLINTDNAPYQHIVDRRAMNKRMQNLESTVGGIANSLNQILEMIQRADESKRERSKED